ncbi:MAG: UPF0236 family protein [Lachnospiraceae bacterium]|nr:UPF0236 family protein [Lachnospiraceae bacterium]
MTIAVEIDFCKDNITNFSDLAKSVLQYAHSFGRELLRCLLEERDVDLRETRDTSRYVNKGKRKTCLKTLLGDVEFERTVYIDKAAPEGRHCVHLLDEDLGIDPVGLVAPDACEAIAAAICKMTYRGTSQMLAETTGLTLSPQGVWDVVQKLGTYRGEQLDRLCELAKANRSEGILQTKLLYEEDDGIWLSLQGPDRKKYGSGREMKLGIAYEGALWEGGKTGKARRTLHNKVAYASFESAADYRDHKEGLIASRYDVRQIELRIRNGDGAGWVQGFGNGGIKVLDAYHRNKAVLTHVQDPEYRQILFQHIYDGNVSLLLNCLEGMINSESDLKVQEHYRELLTYFANNKDGLLSAYDRGIKIPETREPGIIHHSRLGCMESNVYTLIGNRMKGGRASWSVRGAANLANLLCLYHTTGLSGMFCGLADILPEEVPAMDISPLSAAKVPLSEGKGYEYRNQAFVSNVPWLKEISRYRSLADIRLT